MLGATSVLKVQRVMQALLQMDKLDLKTLESA
jgi:hypothetical protein